MTRHDDVILPPSIDPKTQKLAVRKVMGRNAGSTRTVLQVRSFPEFASDEPDTLGGTNTAPSPLELALASLVACDGVIIHGVAKAMNFAYVGVDFQCAGVIDVRGPKGVPGIRPYFETVDLEIVVYSDEPLEKLEKLKKNVEFRCPIMNLFQGASVAMNVTWKQQPTREFDR